MNDFSVENRMVLDRPYGRNRAGYEAQDVDDADDCPKTISPCRYCDREGQDGEMSEINGMCSDCYAEALKKLRTYAEAQGDNAVYEVFQSLTA